MLLSAAACCSRLPQRDRRRDQRRRELTRLKRGRASLMLATSVVLLLLFGLLSMPGSAVASAQSCGTVSKKIFAYNEGPPFYKAKVLLVSGSAPCSEARRVIWKSLKAGGFNGVVNGWRCQAKGNYDPFIEKCSKENPRRVIKSTKPKPCRACQRSYKRVQLSSKGWKWCGRFHLAPGTDVNMEALHYPCLGALEVVAQMITDPGLIQCGEGCEAKGFHCYSPGAIKGGIYGAGNGFICVRGGSRIRLKGAKPRNHG